LESRLKSLPRPWIPTERKALECKSRSLFCFGESKSAGAFFFPALKTLQTLLTILDGQKLGAGYLTPAGNGTALETVIALKKQFDPYTLIQNPLARPATLFTPAWVGSLGAGKDAIFLAGVDGALDLSHPSQQPAYVFVSS
jgi:hypothetical protein